MFYILIIILPRKIIILSDNYDLNSKKVVQKTTPP